MGEQFFIRWVKAKSRWLRIVPHPDLQSYSNTFKEIVVCQSQTQDGVGLPGDKGINKL
jgi:hypothetical protein